MIRDTKHSRCVPHPWLLYAPCREGYFDIQCSGSWLLKLYDCSPPPFQEHTLNQVSTLLCKFSDPTETYTTNGRPLKWINSSSLHQALALYISCIAKPHTPTVSVTTCSYQSITSKCGGILPRGFNLWTLSIKEM